MNRSIKLLGSGVIFLMASLSLSAQDAKDKKDKKPAAPNYLPLEVGNKWTYELKAKGESITILSEIKKIEKIGDVPLARLETTLQGKSVGVEHLQQTAAGVFRHRYNEAEADPPICILKYPAKNGGKWKGKAKVGNDMVVYSGDLTEEEVTVAAGKFKTIRVDLRVDIEGKALVSSIWYAENVGVVRQTFRIEDVDAAMELTKFERAPMKKKSP